MRTSQNQYKLEDTSKTLPYNFFTGIPYQGMNIQELMSASNCREWATFLQWKKNGYKVKKGSKGTGIRTVVEADKKNKRTGKIETSTAMRYYTVFNHGQVEKVENLQGELVMK